MPVAKPVTQPAVSSTTDDVEEEEEEEEEKRKRRRRVKQILWKLIKWKKMWKMLQV